MIKNFFAEMKHYICFNNYKKKLKTLKNKKDKIRVAFLVSENSKWGYQSLYEQMAEDDKFEPLILVSLLNRVHKGGDTTRNNLEENYLFFKNQGMNVDYAYKNGNYIDLKNFKPDIVFYEQPWDIPKIHKPLNVSKFALTCYCDYGLGLLETEYSYRSNFHYLIYKIFADSQLSIEKFETIKNNASKNCINLGHPKLDVYFKSSKGNINEIWKNAEKIKIIYAPHHSFEENSLKLATFLWNGNFILEYAKKHPETTWVFKPHPQFKLALLNNKIMGTKEIDAYYEEWDKIGKINVQGNYFDIFKTSDLMITDCCSFLGEYLPTGKPLIRLCNNNSIGLSKLGQEVTKNYYKVENIEFLRNILDNLIQAKTDNKQEERQNAISLLIDFNMKSSEKICKYIKLEIDIND